MNPHSLCLVCCEQLASAPQLVLPCSHSFHKACIRDYLQSLLLNNCEVRISCPQQGCSSAIPYQLICQCLDDAELVDKLNDFLLRKHGKLLDNHQKIQECPRHTCQNIFVIERDSSVAKCDKCEYRFCTKCCRAYHGPTECRELQTVSMVQLLQAIQQNQLRNCPVCQVLIEKRGGCNFMTCQSPHCATHKTHFCYLCGVQLLKEQHHSHFQNNTPYSNKCVNYGKVKNVLQINKNPCPECKTCNPNICKVMSRAGRERILMCTNCGIHCICGTKVNDRNFRSHLEGQCPKCAIF